MVGLHYLENSARTRYPLIVQMNELLMGLIKKKQKKIGIFCYISYEKVYDLSKKTFSNV